MRVFLIVFGFVFLALGGVNLLELLSEGRADTKLGAALFAVLFLVVAVLCFAFWLGGGGTGFGRKHCPFCTRRIPRRATLCPHCHRAVPEG